MFRDDISRRQFADVDRVGQCRQERRPHRQEWPERCLETRVNQRRIHVSERLLGRRHRALCILIISGGRQFDEPPAARLMAASTDPLSGPITSIRSDNPIVGEKENNWGPEPLE